MRTKLGFYLKESLKYVKDSKLAILTLAIAVGMVAGFGYYFDSAQYYINLETNYNTFDYVVKFNNQNAHSLSFNIGEDERYVENMFLNSKLNLEDSYYYQIYKNPRLFLYLTQNKYSSFSWFLMEKDWFTSPRFVQYFEITSGKLPNNENEILVDSQFAQQFNLDLEINNSLKVKLGLINEEIHNISSSKIVGFFKPKKEFIQFGTLQDVIQTGDNIIFQWANFSQHSRKYPNSELIEYMKTHPEFQNQVNFLFEVETLIGFTIDRTEIQVSWLSATSTEFKQNFNQFLVKLPSYVTAYNLISTSLENQFQFQEVVRLAIQFTNLPLYIFAIYIGSLANKMKIRKRYHEFFSMRMRGFPKNMVRNQFLMEAILNSILISILGIFLGIGVFFMGQYWLNPIFLSDFNLLVSSLHFHFTFQTIIESFLFGAILTILATLSSIKHVNNLRTSELSRELQNISGDVDYDEISLYFNRKKLKKSDDEELDIEQFIKKKEELIPKWGIILALSSTIPIILFIIMIFGQQFHVSDTIQELSNLLFNRINLLIILVIISPIFLVIGLIRYLIVESPPRFAKISKFLSKIFVKKRDYFVGIEMVRQKQYQQIIFLAGLYVAMLMFSNVTINTLIRLEKIKENIEIGGDLNFDFTVSKMSFENQSDIMNFKNLLLNQTDGAGNQRFDDLTSVFVKEQFTGRNMREIFFVNLSDYYSLIFANQNKEISTPNLLN
ncbi:MAG: FtsX-like permease family protein, partial [Promethearchaeota archaeon]